MHPRGSAGPSTQETWPTALALTCRGDHDCLWWNLEKHQPRHLPSPYPLAPSHSHEFVARTRALEISMLITVGVNKICVSSKISTNVFGSLRSLLTWSARGPGLAWFGGWLFGWTAESTLCSGVVTSLVLGAEGALCTGGLVKLLWCSSWHESQAPYGMFDCTFACFYERHTRYLTATLKDFMNTPAYPSRSAIQLSYVQLSVHSLKLSVHLPHALIVAIPKVNSDQRSAKFIIIIQLWRV